MGGGCWRAGYERPDRMLAPMNICIGFGNQKWIAPGSEDKRQKGRNLFPLPARPEINLTSDQTPNECCTYSSRTIAVGQKMTMSRLRTTHIVTIIKLTSYDEIREDGEEQERAYEHWSHDLVCEGNKVLDIRMGGLGECCRTHQSVRDPVGGSW